MKMNWGKGIAIALVLFIGFILYLAINLMMHSADLESADYYNKEIEYESEIVSINNANALKEKPVVSITETHVLIQFPSDIKFEKSELMLNRPNNKDQDLLYKIQDTKTFTIDKSTLNKGVYNYRLTYVVDGKNCIQKEQIYI
jgi:hypothetical protein